MAQIAVRLDSGIALVTLSSPPEGQIGSDTIAELAATVSSIEADATVRAVVVTGGLEGIFASHYSVQELEDLARRLRDGDAAAPAAATALLVAFEQVVSRIEASPKPWIAAINGTCLGTGFELALACDIRIVEDGDHSIGLPEVNVGLLPGGGGTQRLPRLIGEARALELILMGRTVSPIQAVQLGLAQELAPDLAIDAAMIMARRLADQHPPAIARIKQLVRGARTTPIEVGAALERERLIELLGQREVVELLADLNHGYRDITD